MSLKRWFCYFLSLFASFILSSCYRYHPPYNNFQPYYRSYLYSVPGALVGGIVGATGGPAGVIAGAAAGGVLVGTVRGLHKDSKPQLIKELQKEDIQFVQYGDTMTLIVPTDRYYLINSRHFNELCYPGLANLVKLIKLYPCTPVYIAAFTDNVGSHYNKKMITQARAEAMLTFLWANGIPAQHLSAEGYEDKYDVADNKLIHGSAQNRRLEIQWINGPYAQPKAIPCMPHRPCCSK